MELHETALFLNCEVYRSCNLQEQLSCPSIFDTVLAMKIRPLVFVSV